MDSTLRIEFDFDDVLYKLICIFAFTIPFELILEVLFDIETVFKPFRVAALLIIGVFGLKTLKLGLTINTNDRADFFIYLMIVYGVIVSCTKMVTGVFNYNMFSNDLLLLGLLIINFFIIKSTPLSRKQMLTIYKYLVVGVTINSLYIFYQFTILGIHGRIAGFIDNPNYGSLGVAAILIYVLMIYGNLRSIRKQVLYLIYMAFLIYIFVIEGSRTGLVVLMVSILFIFYYYSIKKKIAFIVIGGLLSIFIIAKSGQYSEFAGGPLNLVSRVAYDVNTGEQDVRFRLWKGLFVMLESEGYAGMGIGQYKAKFSHYYRDNPDRLIAKIVSRGYYLSTHSDYLAILTDYGLPGLGLYILFIYFTAKKLQIRILDYGGDEDDKIYYRLSVVLFFSLMIFGLASENFQHPLFWFLLAFSTKDVPIAKTTTI